MSTTSPASCSTAGPEARPTEWEADHDAIHRPRPPTALCPFVGPRPFRLGEPLFGRDREIPKLLDLLIAERIVLMFSPSGAGKTSLIQAGLIPALREEGFLDLPIIRREAADSPRRAPTPIPINRLRPEHARNPWNAPGRAATEDPPEHLADRDELAPAFRALGRRPPTDGRTAAARSSC